MPSRGNKSACGAEDSAIAATISPLEVQHTPDLLLAIKGAVDLSGHRSPGRFVLTGSANLLMMERVAESLAGRAAARMGGLPVPSHELKTDDDRAVWFSGYVQTYLERDLQDLRAVQDLADFRRLMRAACLRIGNLVNQTEMGRDLGMSQPQVHRYLNLLETSFQAVRIPAYGVNRTRRLIKTPKLYWSDPGLALFLSGEIEPRGAHLENLVLLDLLVWRDIQARRPEVHYWRTASGLEVDFVVESGDRLLPIEIKSGARLDSCSAHALEAFLDDHDDQAQGGLILYGGTDTFQFSKRVIATPWWRAC